MGIVNKNNALYMATGVDNSGLYIGKEEAMGILKAMSREVTSFDVFGGIGVSAGVAFAKAAASAYDFEKRFQKSMLEVATLSKEVGGSLTDYMNRVMDIIRDVPVAGDEAAKALYQIVSAGHDGANGLMILEASAKAAIGGVTDTATAADAMTTILNAYGLEASQAASISDKLFMTVKLGKTDFTQLGQSIAQAAPIAASFGIDLDEILAAVASITKQGVPTSEAMTKIRAAILGTANELGDAAFKGRTFQEALQLIYDKAGGSSTEMKKLLGTDEALQAALMVTGNNAQNAANDLIALGNSAGAAEEAFQKMMESAENQLALLGNNITAFLRPMGEAILKEVSSIASAFNEAFRTGNVPESMRTLGDLIVVVTSAMVGYEASVVAVNIVQRLNAAILRQTVLERRLENLAIYNGIVGHKALTTAQLKQIATKKILISALKTQFLAMQRVTAMLLTNPYAWAAAGAAVLGITIYKLATYESELGKAHKRLETATSGVESEVNKEMNTLSSLNDKLQQNKKGSEEWKSVKDSIVQQYGQYFKGLDGEIQRVGDLSSTYDKLSEAIRKSVSVKNLKTFADKNNQDMSDEMTKYLQGALKDLRSVYDNKTANELIGKIREYVFNGTDIDKESYGKIARGKGWGFSTGALTKMKRARQTKLAGEMNLDDYMNIYGISKDEANEILYGITSKTGGKDGDVISKTYEEDYKVAQETWEKAKKAYEEIAKDRSKFTTKQYKKAKDEKEKAEAEFKNLGGVTDTSKLTGEATKTNELLSANSKLDELQAQQTHERIRQQQDLENQVTQSKIDAMDSGAEKELAQRDLNNKLEIQALQRQKEDYIQAAIQAQKELFDAREELNAKQKKGYVKKSFDPSSVSVDTSAFDTIIDNTTKQQQNDKLHEQEDSWDEYLIKYGTFQGKKAALTRKYQKLIDEEPDAGKAAALQKELEEALSALDVDKLKQEINWELVFGDLSKVSKKELDKVNVQLKKFRKSSEYQNMTVEQKKVIDEALDSIQSAIIDKGGILGDLPGQLDNLRKAQEELEKAQDEYNDSLKNGTLAEQEAAKKKQNTAEQNVVNAKANANKSSQKAIDNITGVTNAITQLGEADMSLSEFGNAVGSLVDALSQSGSKIGGIIAAILSLLDQFSEDGGVQFGKNLLENVVNAIGGTVEVPFKMLGIDLGLGGADYSGYNEMVAQYDNLLEIWDELLDKKKAYIKESYGAEAAKAGEEALEIAKNELEVQRKLAAERLSAGSSAGSHSQWYRMWKGSYKWEGKNWRDVAGEIEKQLKNADLGDVNFDSMDSMTKMTSEQLQWIKENYAGLWSAMDGEFRGHLENIIKYGETEKEILESVKEQMNGISFDSFENSYWDMLADMNNGNEELAENFEKQLQQSIIKAMMAEKYKSQIRKLYDTWADYGDDGYTKDEVNDLREMQKQLSDAMLAERDRWAEIFGWSADEDASSEKGVTGKLEAALTEGTANEVLGTMNMQAIDIRTLKEMSSAHFQEAKACYIDVASILEQTRQIAVNTKVTADSNNQIYERLDKGLEEIKSELSAISKNTKSSTGRK